MESESNNWSLMDWLAFLRRIHFFDVIWLLRFHNGSPNYALKRKLWAKSMCSRLLGNSCQLWVSIKTARPHYDRQIEPFMKLLIYNLKWQFRLGINSQLCLLFFYFAGNFLLSSRWVGPLKMNSLSVQPSSIVRNDTSESRFVSHARWNCPSTALI